MTMNDEKGNSSRSTEGVEQTPSTARVEETAEAAFSGYEVGFGTLALIYVG
jgi:hypothetical protein